MYKMAKKKIKQHKKIEKKEHKRIVKKSFEEFKIPLTQLTKRHSHKGFYIGFSIILALIILSIIILYLPEEARQPVTITPTKQIDQVKNETKTITIEPIISQSIFDEKTLLNEMSKCISDSRNIVDGDINNYIAINSNNISACESLEEDQKIFCQAKINKDASYCNEADDKDICKAIILDNKNLCNNNQECIKLISKDISVCNLLELKQSLVCKFELTNDKKYYDLVIQEISKDCTDDVYNRFAFLYKEPELCLRVLNKELKQNCQSAVSTDS